MWLVYLLVYVIYGSVWGFVTQKIVENKGYSENWFWWGFFFGIFAVLVAVSKPQCQSDYEAPSWVNNGLGRSVSVSGGWICSCGRSNPSYVGTCVCGQTRDESMNQDKILAKSRLADVANEARLQRMKQEEAKALADGGWRCRRCGKVHPYYVGSCGCGLTRQQSKEMDRKAERLAEEGKKAEEANKEKQLDKDETEEQRDKFEEIKKYKELLDNGIITEEEYNKKKSELLGL